ncbi:MAG TPA: hypothetical protein VG407_16375 [Caulobacteraceae bacterium]|jgi:hypothetical protein|nr:hypothetical protein [Caulobacteraceae bacterium]
MRHAMLSLAVAALAAALALSAPGKSLAGDPYAYGTYETGYDTGWYGDGGWYDDVRRDGNVFYNAYNSYDGYYRHRYGGYWERPYDGYGYGYGYGYGCDECGGYGYGGYGYGDGGYGYGYGDEGYGDGGYYGGSGYPRRNGKVYYSNYGNYDPSHREIRRDRRRIECEADGGRFYAGRCF